MKKNNMFAIALIALGLLVILGVSLGFHSYTEDFYMVQVLVEDAEGEVSPVWRPATAVTADDVVAMTDGGEMVVRPPNWRAGEHPLHLSTVRTVALIGLAVSLLGVILLLAGKAKELRRQDVIGLIITLLGMAAIIGFLTAFYPCTYQMPAMPRAMRCVFTMRVLYAVAGVISGAGIFMLLSRSREFAKGLNVMVILSALAFIAIPTMATGVCVAMICVELFRPFAIVMGCVMLVASAIGAVLLRKREDNEDDAEASDNV